MTIDFDAFPSVTSKPILTITGTVDGNVTALEVGPDLSNLVATDLSGQRFSVVVELDPGRNEVVFQTYGAASQALTPIRKVITYNKQSPELFHVKNSLDKHGELIGIDRIPGEKNVSYKKRLLQAAQTIPGSRVGVLGMMATELGFAFSMDMVRVYIDRTTYNRPKLTNPYIRVTLDAVEYTADELITFESPVVFDYGNPYITPSSTVSPFGPIKLLTEGGEEVDGDDFEYDEVLNRVFLKDLDYAGHDLTLVYNTVTSFSISSGSISTLETTIESGSDLELEVFTTDFHSGADDADWILPLSWTPIPTQEDYPSDDIDDDPGVYLNISEIKTFALHEFRDTFLDSNGSGLASDLEDYVREIGSIDRRNWARIIPGRDGLRDANSRPLDDYFPHLADPVRGVWGNNEYNIHEVQYLGAGVDDPSNPFKGVQPLQWQSGSGTLGDLEPGVVRQELQSYADIVEDSKIPVNILYGAL